MKILILDNYDSFTYNLVHLVEKVVNEREIAEVDVCLNDEVVLEKVNQYDKIILSPGPGLPKDAGALLQLIREFAPRKSILGVCLGHQAIGEVFGGTLLNPDWVYHGVQGSMNVLTKPYQEEVEKNGEAKTESPLVIFDHNRMFRNLKSRILVGRYHSWMIGDENFPEELEVTARDENGYIMAVHHRTFDVQGVQFHPESVLTPDGEIMIRNWIFDN